MTVKIVWLPNSSHNKNFERVKYITYARPILNYKDAKKIGRGQREVVAGRAHHNGKHRLPSVMSLVSSLLYIFFFFFTRVLWRGKKLL